MSRDDIIRMAREAGSIDSEDVIETARTAVAAAEREAWPRLDPVILWLENGGDPREAAKELRVYAAAIRSRSQQ